MHESYPIDRAEHRRCEHTQKQGFLLNAGPLLLPLGAFTEKIVTRNLVGEGSGEHQVADDHTRRESPISWIIAGLKQIMGAVVLKAVVESKRPTVEPQEG